MILLPNNVINIDPKHASVTARALVGNTLFANDEEGNVVQLGTIKSSYFGPVLNQDLMRMVNEAERQDRGAGPRVNANQVLKKWVPLVHKHIKTRPREVHKVDRIPLKGLALVKAKLKGLPTYEERRWVAQEGVEYYHDGQQAYDTITTREVIILHEAIKEWLLENLPKVSYESGAPNPNVHDSSKVMSAAEALARRESGPEISFSKATEEQASVVAAFFSQKVDADKLEKMLSSAFGVKVKVKPLSGMGYDIGDQTLEELITTLHREE